MKHGRLELLVGLFMLVGIVSAVVMCLKVAGLVLSEDNNTYTVMAKFDNIGSLKIRAPVKIGGVLIGRVERIDLDPGTLTPVVYMAIESRFKTISNESKASILTAGLIGEQYIGIIPGFYDEDLGTAYLKDGDVFKDTGSALVLEDLIAKFAFGNKE